MLSCFVHRYTNTTACISRISFIDGAKGILRYRGYPIEQLAEKANYSEVGPAAAAVTGRICLCTAVCSHVWAA